MDSPEQSTPQHVERRAWPKYIRKTRRTLAASAKVRGASLWGVCGEWLLPWTLAQYPGIGRGLAELCGGRAAIATVRDWRRGKRNAPSWAVRALCDAIEARARRGLQLVEALRVYQAERERAETQRRAGGFRIVDPVTGRDKRNRAGTRRNPE